MGHSLPTNPLSIPIVIVQTIIIRRERSVQEETSVSKIVAFLVVVMYASVWIGLQTWAD